MNWRIIKTQKFTAFENMALDEAISESVRAGIQPPTIRFYRWKPSAVSIGYHQSLNDEIDIKKCEELGVDIVRRRTGGGAVYHDNQGELTYSVIAPDSEFPAGIIDSYKLICGWIIDGLANVEIEAEFSPINDILVSGKKISGNAQTRRQGILLQHGTILYDLDVRKMFSLLKVGADKISDKMIQAVEERVTRVLDHSKVTVDGLEDALLAGFTSGKEFELGNYSEEELNKAKELAETRYSTKDWNYWR